MSLISTSSSMSRAQVAGDLRYGSGSGACSGAGTNRSSSRASGVTQAEIDVANDFPEEGAERLVLPRLDVPRAPVVDEHDAEDVVAERGARDGGAERAPDADDEAELELEVEAPARAEARLGLVGRFSSAPHGRATGVPLTTIVPLRPW